MTRSTRAALFLAILVVAIGGSVFFRLYGPDRSYGEGQEAITFAVASSTTPVVPVPVPTIAPPAPGSARYVNEAYAFSFSYPQGVTVREHAEDGTMTVTAEDATRMKGFQVFIVPYAEPTISDERFQIDEPSGVRTNAKNAMVGGERAVSFDGYSVTLGDTKETWVIHGGYLYEITTLAGMEDWFAPILASWSFS